MCVNSVLFKCEARCHSEFNDSAEVPITRELTTDETSMLLGASAELKSHCFRGDAHVYMCTCGFIRVAYRGICERLSSREQQLMKGYTTEENVPPFPNDLICQEMWDFVSPSPLYGGLLVEPILYLCAGDHSCCGFKSVMAMAGLEDIVLQHSSPSSGS